MKTNQNDHPMNESWEMHLAAAVEELQRMELEIEMQIAFIVLLVDLIDREEDRPP